MDEGEKKLVTKVAMESEHLILRSRLYFMKHIGLGSHFILSSGNNVYG